MKVEVKRVRQWLTQAALPMWAERGVDRIHGGFVERLTLDAQPDLAVTKRVRVQARQLYVFAHAAMMGFHPDALRLASDGYRFLSNHAMPDGAGSGLVHSLLRDGRVADPRRDTYDHAFVLFALSWYARASGDADAPLLIRELTEASWRLLGHPSGAGLRVDDCGTLELHQNPHMHLFEAMLAAFDATSDAWYLERADELFMLFRDRMFDRRHGVLREYYDADWHPVADERRLIVEPGHHCEWVWLLKRYADRKGSALCPEAYALFQFVEIFGRRDGGILLCDQLRPDGSMLKLDTRSWPQTEAIKADVAMAEVDGRPLGTRTDAIVTALFDRFIDPAPPGGWIDWTDAAGSPLVGAIPASTFYHLFLAFSEYLAAHDAV